MSWGLCSIACTCSVVPFLAKLPFAQQHSMPYAPWFVLGPCEWFRTCKPEISWGWVSTLFWTIDFPTNFFLGGVLRKCGREHEGATSGVGFNSQYCNLLMLEMRPRLKAGAWTTGNRHVCTYESLNCFWCGQDNQISTQRCQHDIWTSLQQHKWNKLNILKCSSWAGLILTPTGNQGDTRNTCAILCPLFWQFRGKLSTEPIPT